MSADTGGLFMHETPTERNENNCAFFGGHSFEDGAQKCIWCTARKTDEVQAND